MVVDSFDPSLFKSASYIPKNEETKHHWDLDEVSGFISMNGGSDSCDFKVIQTSDNAADQKAFEILKALRNYVYSLKDCLVQVLSLNPIKCVNVRDELILFIVTKCTLQEIPINTSFEGLNKPKEIVHNESVDDLHLEKDNEYRAGRRHILLNLRAIDQEGHSKFKTWKQLKSLLMHELSHTCANHILYRTAGNHAKDFKKCESFLKKYCANAPTLHQAEQQLVNLLD